MTITPATFENFLAIIASAVTGRNPMRASPSRQEHAQPGERGSVEEANPNTDGQRRRAAK